MVELLIEFLLVSSYLADLIFVQITVDNSIDYADLSADGYRRITVLL